MLKRTYIETILHYKETTNTCEPLQHFAQKLAEEKRQKRNDGSIHSSFIRSKPSPVPPPHREKSSRPFLPKKKPTITVSKCMLPLVQKISREQYVTSKPITSVEFPMTHDDPPVVPEPRQVLYTHHRIIAVLATGTHGYTLSNAVQSISAEGGLDKLVKDVEVMKIRLLYCFDEDTFEKWNSLLKHSNCLVQKLCVKKMKPFPRIRCIFCKQHVCHKWNANAGIAHQLKIPFDPISHSKTPESGHQTVSRKKVAAVLCVATNGFTLCNGVNSIVVKGNVNNSSIAQNVLKMKVKILNCFDERTFNKWMDVQNSYEEEFEKLKVEIMKPIEMKPCVYCKDKTCHQWRASVGICVVYKLIFDPIEH